MSTWPQNDWSFLSHDFGETVTVKHAVSQVTNSWTGAKTIYSTDTETTCVSQKLSKTDTPLSAAQYEAQEIYLFFNAALVTLGVGDQIVRTVGNFVITALEENQGIYKAQCKRV